MRLKVPTLLAALAATCAADTLKYWEEYWGFGHNLISVFYTSTSSYFVKGESGCRGTDVPGMTHFCVDWPRQRGHFRFHGQNKRCMKQTFVSDWYACDDGHDCRVWVMEEAPCTW
ncbi:hypothetical protein G6O67_004198 [Ophiocordyceps sinensis]|uniref:Secreted protein n=1 Tax=Ophiocordyceps sinensis TaxID=72228 RepID=A0A8H4PNV0_9HYPO|nr:hypothetical protein G6O67_004198 [Ophiocordyceps sinensis]